MELLYGLAGVMGLSIFAAVLGFDLRTLFDSGDRAGFEALQDDDPNSTLSITREVLIEKLDQPRAEVLMGRS